MGSRFSRRFSRDGASLLVGYEVASSYSIQDLGCQRTEYKLSIDVSSGGLEEHIEPEGYGEGC